MLDELKAIREKHGDERRTAIVEEEGEFRVEDLIADEDVVITATSTGYIKRTALDEYRSQRRGGKGLIGMTTREEDVVQHLFVANTHAYLLIFTDRGQCYWLRVYDVPEVSRSSKGKSIANLVHMNEGEKVAALLRVQAFPDQEGERFIVMGTQEGHGQEDGPGRLLQPAVRRHHRDPDRRRRPVDRRRGDRRPEGPDHRLTQRHGDSVRRIRRAADGPVGVRRARHATSRRRRSRRA